MLSHVSQNITFAFFFTRSKVGVVPANAPTVDVERKGSGSLVVSGGSAVAGLVAGVYYYTLSSGSDATADNYVAVCKTADATVDLQHVPAMWIVGNTVAAALPTVGPANSAHPLLTSGVGTDELHVSAGGIFVANNGLTSSSTAGNSFTSSMFATSFFDALLMNHTGTAQGATATTITLANTASGVDGYYVGQLIRIRAQTGALQVRTITGYVGATFVATVDRAWATTPDNTSTYAILSANSAALDSTLHVLDSAGITTLLSRITAAVATASALATLQTAVNNLNNLSALANMHGPLALEVPATGSIAYQYTILIKDTEGHLIDLNASPTVSVANTAGTDRSGNLSAVAHPATGQYTFSYTVAAGAAQEGATITAAGTSAAPDSSPRIVVLGIAIVAVDTATAVAAIKAKTDTIGTNAADSPNEVTAQNTIAAKLDATMSSRAAAFTTVTLAASQPNYAPAKAGDAMALTTGERTTLYGGIAAQIITDHGSGSYLRNTEPDNTTLGRIALGLQIVGSGPNYQFTTQMLANAPAGGGGGGTTVEIEATDGVINAQ